MRFLGAFIPAGAILLACHGAAHAQQKPTPYWASISAAKARMRTGPGANFPANWEYVRADLPVRVLVVRKEWRKIEDPDGTQGWMRSFLLSEKRTAIIRDAERALRTRPDASAGIAWRAQAGVVGVISRCFNGWCRFDVRGRQGYVETAHLWGIAPGETLD